MTGVMLRLLWWVMLVLMAAAVFFGAWCMTRPESVTVASGILCIVGGAIGVNQLVAIALLRRDA